MRKITPVDQPIHELIKERWSPRAFSSRPVEQAKLLSILEAARWAPSSRNEQPWSFIVAIRDNPAEFERLLNCLKEGNRRWAKCASVLMLSVARLNFERDDQPNRHAFHDAGLALANLMTQATALGLYTHPMGGFYQDKVRETYQIPETHAPVVAIAIGYPGNLEQLPEDLQKREQSPRVRKPLNEFVFGERWGQTATVIEEAADDTN